MNQRNESKSEICKGLALILSFVLLSNMISVCTWSTKAEETETPAATSSASGGDDFLYYNDVYSTYMLDGKTQATTVSVDMSLLSFSKSNVLTYEEFQGKQLVVWKKEQGDLQASFSCAKGYYSIEIDCLCDTSKTADIIRSVKLDGKLPFSEADNMKLTRVWEMDGTTTTDAQENERAAVLVQKKKLQTIRLTDLYSLYSDPLLFSLEEGQHTITMEYISGDVSIAAIRLVPYTATETYADYANRYSGNSYTGEAVTVEGENSYECSDRTLSAKIISNPSMSPYQAGQDRVNAIGGWTWRNGNDWISWKINVPEDGYYKLALRVGQDYNGLVTYRRIEIDNELPFKELKAYPFYASSSYQTVQIGGDTPYLFYLTAGEHTLSMTAVAGGMTPIINGLQKLSLEMSDLVKEIRTIVGTSPDANFDYEIDKKIPGLLSTMTDYAERITAYAEQLKKNCQTTPEILSSILSEAEKLQSMIKNPRKIPTKLDDLSAIQADLADYSTTIRYMPLSIDFIQLMNPETRIVQRKSTFLQTVQMMYLSFIQTFMADYNQVDGDTSSTKSINIWISRGRDWGELLQQMIEEQFTPKTGIKVNLNILPSGTTGVVSGTSPLLLSIVSGNEPDVALGSDMDTPVELAIRGAAVNLKEFSNYEEIAARFHSAAISPFNYKSGVYALPETMDIPLLIYRTDIFEELGIAVPNTWEELWTKTLPGLKQINSTFYVNSLPNSGTNTAKIAMYSTFLFQNEGSYYTEDGQSALDSDVAYKAFSDWTKNFTQYQTSQSANLYNEMRTGTIPLAIGYLSDYLMLDIAAPELYGRFDIAPIPGTVNENGEIARYGSGSVTSAVLFESSDKQEEAWQFLDWWTSDVVQEQFSSDIVAKVGPTARWYSANLSAFYSLPWGSERAAVIEEWLPWYKNPSNTLGGYMTSRCVINAWTRTVMSNMKARDSLEQAYKEAQTEITRKKEEYGVNDR